MKIFKSLFCLIAILGLLVSLTGCPKTANKADPENSTSIIQNIIQSITPDSDQGNNANSAQKIEPKGMAYFSYFDTVSNIYSYAGDSQETFAANCGEISGILGKYHKLFDIYYEHSGVTNLKTLNKNAGGEPLKVEQELIDFLLYAKELYTLTNGEMNIMMGSVLRIWHDCREEGTRIPTNEELQEAALHTSIDLLEIDVQNQTVRISDPKASIDVGALGKGYATEKAAKHLESIGATSYVLNIGGNIRIIGTKPDGSGWKTGIKNPANPSTYSKYLMLANISCVTSGNYERYYTVGGQRYHHIIDKDTLMPSTYFSSVTILTSDSGLADSLSTALFSMSYEDGLNMVQRIGGVEVVWITPEGEIYTTSGIADLESTR